MDFDTTTGALRCRSAELIALIDYVRDGSTTPDQQWVDAGVVGTDGTPEPRLVVGLQACAAPQLVVNALVADTEKTLTHTGAVSADACGFMAALDSVSGQFNAWPASQVCYALARVLRLGPRADTPREQSCKAPEALILDLFSPQRDTRALAWGAAADLINGHDVAQVTAAHGYQAWSVSVTPPGHRPTGEDNVTFLDTGDLLLRVAGPVLGTVKVTPTSPTDAWRQLTGLFAAHLPSTTPGDSL